MSLIKAVKDRESLYLPILARAFHAVNLPPEMGPAIAKHESNFRATAVNATGGDLKRGTAIGLCQMTVTTARTLGFSGEPLELQGPSLNSELAAKLCAHNWKATGHSLEQTIAAYNCGLGLVSKNEIPAMTKEVYVPAVLELMKHYRDICAVILKIGT